jgi:hypothetical protein
MGTCARCGATVIDGDSWKEAYLTQLKENQTMLRALTGFRKLFRNHLWERPDQLHVYSFDLRDAIVCGLRDEIPKK